MLLHGWLRGTADWRAASRGLWCWPALFVYVCVCVQVKPDSSVAQRSAASGRLVLVMPKEDPQQAVVDVAYLRSVGGRGVNACAQPQHHDKG